MLIVQIDANVMASAFALDILVEYHRNHLNRPEGLYKPAPARWWSSAALFGRASAFNGVLYHLEVIDSWSRLQKVPSSKRTNSA